MKSVLQLTDTSKKKKKKIGANGKTYAAEEFNRKKLMDNLENWLTEITQNEPKTD